MITHVTAAAVGVCWQHPLQNTTGWHLSTGVGERALTNGCTSREVSNYYEHFSSSPRGLAIGVDAEWLELSWNNSKPTRCLLVRPTYQATTHHAGAAAFILNGARAPLGVTHHTNERARETSTTAPPCPLPMNSTRGTGRAIANEPCFVSRVVVVVVSSAVVGRVFGSCTEEPNGGRHRGRK